MKTTPAELRELDAWIAINVFDFAWRRLNRRDTQHHLVKQRHGEHDGCFDPLPGFVPSDEDRQCAPHYTYDQATSRELEKKCIEQGANNIEVWKSDDQWYVALSHHHQTHGVGETLEIAFALFAKKLWSK